MSSTVSWARRCVEETGFALSARELRAAADLGREVETQMYTDGLAVFAAVSYTHLTLPTTYPV